MELLLWFFCFSFPRQLDKTTAPPRPSPQGPQYSRAAFQAVCMVSFFPATSWMSSSVAKVPCPSSPGHSNCIRPNSDHSRRALLTGKLPQHSWFFYCHFRGLRSCWGNSLIRSPSFSKAAQFHGAQNRCRGNQGKGLSVLESKRTHLSFSLPLKNSLTATPGKAAAFSPSWKFLSGKLTATKIYPAP